MLLDKKDIVVVVVGDGGVLVAVDVSGDRSGVMVMVLLFLPPSWSRRPR